MNVQSDFLRIQRQFPNDDLKELANQSDQAYIDIAQKVNKRINGIFPTRNPFITGESWYLSGSVAKKETFRQVYEFFSTAPIAHGINFASIAGFTRCFGSFSDGTNDYGAIYASNVAIAGQVTFYITPTQIVILSGAGAPTIVNGIIVLEWLSQP